MQDWQRKNPIYPAEKAELLNKLYILDETYFVLMGISTWPSKFLHIKLPNKDKVSTPEAHYQITIWILFSTCDSYFSD